MFSVFPGTADWFNSLVAQVCKAGESVRGWLHQIDQLHCMTSASRQCECRTRPTPVLFPCEGIHKVRHQISKLFYRAVHLKSPRDYSLLEQHSLITSVLLIQTKESTLLFFLGLVLRLGQLLHPCSLCWRWITSASKCVEHQTVVKAIFCLLKTVSSNRRHCQSPHRCHYRIKCRELLRPKARGNHLSLSSLHKWNACECSTTKSNHPWCLASASYVELLSHSLCKFKTCSSLCRQADQRCKGRRPTKIAELPASKT